MITEENIKKIEKFIEIRNKGYYCSGSEVTNVYNDVFNTRLASTNCSQCIKIRISQLETELNKYKKASEALKNVDPNNSPSEENKASDEPKNGENKPKRVGRPKKK